MCFPKEGAFAGVNCQVLVKSGPNADLGAAFMNRDARSVGPARSRRDGLGGARRSAGSTFKPEIAGAARLSGHEDGRTGPVQPGLGPYQRGPAPTGSRRSTRSSRRDGSWREARTIATDIAVEDVAKSYGHRSPYAACQLRRRAGARAVPARPVRLRQDHDHAHDRRPRSMPSAGRIRIDGQDGAPAVAGPPPQHRHAVPELRAVPASDGGAATSPSAWRCAASARPRSPRRVEATLAMVRLYALRASALPHQLSGGQQQRVGAGPRAGRSSPRSCCSTSPSARSTRSCARACSIEMRAAAAAARHHDPDGDPRPGRGAHPVGSHRRDAQRPDRADSARRRRSTSGRRRASSPSFIGTSNFFSGPVTHRGSGGYPGHRR